MDFLGIICRHLVYLLMNIRVDRNLETYKCYTFLKIGNNEGCDITVRLLNALYTVWTSLEVVRQQFTANMDSATKLLFLQDFPKYLDMKTALLSVRSSTRSKADDGH